MGSPDNSKFNNQFGEKHLPMVFLPQCTASSVSVHCILGFSALSSRLQCTASVDANVCGKGCKRLRLKAASSCVDERVV